MSKQSFNNKEYIERLKPFHVVVLILAIIILTYYIFLNSNVIYGDSLLVLILFTFLITIPSILISIITVRSFLRSGSWSVLWLGIGTIIFGLSTFFRALFLNISTDNIALTIGTLGSFMAAILFLIGGFFIYNKINFTVLKSKRLSILLQIYAIFLLLLTFIIVICYNGILPTFFISGTGSTLIRELIIALSVIFTFLAALMILIEYYHSKSLFLYLYGLGIMLISIGMYGTIFIISTLTPIFWISRSIQLLGGIYLLIATLILRQIARQQNVSIIDILSNVFKTQSNMNFLLKNISEAIFVFDKNFFITDWNKGAEKIYGWNTKEALGQSIKLIQSNSDDNNEIQNNLLKYGKWTGEIQQKTKNGKELTIYGAISTIKDESNNTIGYLNISHDFTEKKKAENLNKELLESEQQLTEELTVSNEELQSTTEELQVSNEELRNQGDDLLQINKALKKSEERFHDLSDNIPNLAWMADPTGWIYWYNKRWYEYTGTTLEEMQGWGWQKVHHPDYIDKVTEEWSSNINAGNPYDNIFPLKGKDGNYRWFLTRVTPIRDKKGKLLRWFGTNTDITELKQSEDELTRSNEELERFAYVSSHDLQEPLRMVKLYSQLLERRYKDKFDSDADDFIEYIVEGSNRMRELIDDLLEYSRVTSQAKEFEKVELETVLDVVIHNLALSIDENNVLISHESLPSIFADKNQMIQVFQNLISNAIKFHGQNLPEINISVQEDEKEWIFSVSDNGIGIDPKYQKQIFEVFKRLDHNREEYPGSGIGLSITQKIILHHGGRIWVESELGKGATFYFSIPIKTEEYTNFF